MARTAIGRTGAVVVIWDDFVFFALVTCLGTPCLLYGNVAGAEEAVAGADWLIGPVENGGGKTTSRGGCVEGGQATDRLAGPSYVVSRVAM